LDTGYTETTDEVETYGKSKTMVTRGKFEGKHSDLTGKILGAFFQVHKELGYGFSEKVYENALAILLTEMGMKVEPQAHLYVYFHGLIGHLLRNIKYSPSIPRNPCPKRKS
jgi:PD-(D/E)XK nuclease superfamily